MHDIASLLLNLVGTFFCCRSPIRSVRLTAQYSIATMLMRCYSVAPAIAQRFYATEPLPTPGSNNGASVDPKIASIVDQIESLTLLQTSELVSQLKVYIQQHGYGRVERLLLICVLDSFEH